MKKLKEFCKKHKGEIVLGCIAGVAVIYGVKVNKQLKKQILRYAGKDVISWTHKRYWTFEEAKNLLDLNKDIANRFAIVKAGHLGKDVYDLMSLNGSDVIS